jgi:hypothetical protein
VTAPADTFRAVVAHPAWLGMLALVTLVSAALLGGFLSTETGQAAWLDAATAGAPNAQAQYDAMLSIAKYAGYIAAVQMLVMIPIVTVVTAGILYAVFNALGGDALFKQVLAVVAHASVVTLLGQLFTVPINYARGAMASATNLAVFFPGVEPRSFAGWTLSMIDLFIIWYVLVLAIGLGVLYRRRTGPIAGGLYAVYGVIVIVVAAVASRLGGA